MDEAKGLLRHVANGVGRHYSPDLFQALFGTIQLDDAYWSDEHHHGGKSSRGAPGKTPFVVEVQINEKGHPIAMRFTKLQGFRKEEVAQVGTGPFRGE